MMASGMSPNSAIKLIPASQSPQKLGLLARELPFRDEPFVAQRSKPLDAGEQVRTGLGCFNRGLAHRLRRGGRRIRSEPRTLSSPRNQRQAVPPNHPILAGEGQRLIPALLL